MTDTLDHIDPVWFPGEKEEPHHEQLVCGLDIPENHRIVDISENSLKADRFLQWRVEGDHTPPREAGDRAWFLIDGDWVWTEFLGDEWFAETKRQGRFHQARQGRASAQRRDGFIGWRDRQTEEEVADFDQRRTDAVRAAVEAGNRWGFMLPENRDCAKGGRAGGPRTATQTNKQLRAMLKVIERDGVQLVCDRDVIATRIVEKIIEIAPECAPMSPKDVHKIWGGRVSKGWRLVSITP
jgi:hypothetical protein